MPKRKVQDDEEGEVEDNAHQSASEGEVVKKSKQSSATSAKPKASAANLMRVTLSNNFSSALCLQAQSSKKKKKGTTTADGDIQANDEGDKYVDLGRNRRATVHVFKGTSFHQTRFG